jgi:hypothetical protein
MTFLVAHPLILAALLAIIIGAGVALVLTYHALDDWARRSGADEHRRGARVSSARALRRALKSHHDH